MFRVPEYVVQIEKNIFISPVQHFSSQNTPFFASTRRSSRYYIEISKQDLGYNWSASSFQYLISILLTKNDEIEHEHIYYCLDFADII